MNNFAVIGRIGKDAECRYTGSGKPVCGFSLAVDAGFGDNKQTLWLDCPIWGQRAEKVAEYIRKGDRFRCHGELSTREHNGKTYLQLRVVDFDLLGDKRSGEQRQAPAPAPQAPPAEKALADADDAFADQVASAAFAAMPPNA